MEACAAKPNTEKIEQRELEAGKLKNCPYCPELIKPEAKICKHCGCDLRLFALNKFKKCRPRFCRYSEQKPSEFPV